MKHTEITLKIRSNFVGVEKDEKYFHIAEERIKEASNNLNKFMEQEYED